MDPLALHTVLIVYEIIPENTKLYAVSVTADELIRLKKIAGKFANSGEVSEEEYEIMLWLSKRLLKTGRWAQYKLAESTSIKLVPHDGELTIIRFGEVL